MPPCKTYRHSDSPTVTGRDAVLTTRVPRIHGDLVRQSDLVAGGLHRSASSSLQAGQRGSKVGGRVIPRWPPAAVSRPRQGAGSVGPSTLGRRGGAGTPPGG